MQKTLTAIVILFVLFTGCGKQQDPYLIQKHTIGNLTDSTQVKDIKSIFETDSVVGYSGKDEFTININDVDVYDTDRSPLLRISPRQKNDSTSLISSVRIMDKRYKTEKGISLASTFKDIEDNYTITKIDNLISFIIVNVKEINAAFTIDKKELPSNLRFDRSISIEASQIPANAKIKYFFIHWN